MGYEALEKFTDSLQSRFPGARFALMAATSVGNAIRASWTFGPPERTDAVTGMDFVILDGGKISQLFAFVDPAEVYHHRKRCNGYAPTGIRQGESKSPWVRSIRLGPISSLPRSEPGETPVAPG